MTDALIVFAAQFVMIFLHGLQSQNVIAGHRTAAFVTSLCLGICGFYVTGSIASAKGQLFDGPVFWAFVFAGPLGILTSMFVFRKWRKLK